MTTQPARDHWPAERERVKLTPMQRVTIDHLTRSRDEMVPVTLHSKVDAGALIDARARLRVDPATKDVTVTVLIAKILAEALAVHQQLNASLRDDVIVRYAGVNLGIAVAVGEQLVVPVVSDVAAKSAAQLAADLAALRQRAEAAKLGLGDVRGATFTLSSIGMYVGDVTGSAVIPPGQTGILLAGGVQEAPLVRDGTVVAAPVLPLSLTVDHRVVNGAVLSTFFADLLERIRECRFDRG